ncbi:division/cell wall cluster transcriptional repressor MraZ [Salibacter sp.]|uniref:division/cell wall cluster transcriptional repressor MraZ n=1 Tax=Salibacter sp. TaxID=2010995 RepID=UPI002870914A|nr:division/cell wall cluster transcriptional repressor MraZ [Salibacter sp.]MDR9398342.1 division/cell wall cluster transcriptional repressor MraZ [Salibacter sp.]MDR9487584.1 division/cell wall cluster transcriptional repressor MraZ [Salibacter sp.]
MANFIGEYHCKVDTKGRFMMPSGLKKQLDPAAQEKFVINRGFEGCLVLYPMNEWEKETQKFEKLNLFVAKNRKFYRQFHNGATQLLLDGTGRLLLPRTLAKSAEISKEIVLFAYANRIEVWAKDRYEEVMEEDVDDFASLAEDVMGELHDKTDD